MKQRFDQRIFELIPHRPPMMLINHIMDLDISHSSSLVTIDIDTPFYEPNKGVPAWVGIEYMGQTAALIAGYRLKKGLIEPHLGFLIGTRAYKTEVGYFKPNTVLKINCRENAMIADGFAKFDCHIAYYSATAENAEVLATASLSVYRRPIKHEELQ